MDIKQINFKQHQRIHKSDVKKVQAKKKIWVWSYIVVALIFIAAYFLFKLHVFKVFGDYRIPIQKACLGGFVAVIILAISKWIEILIVKRAESLAARYNLIRVIRLLSILLIIMVIVSFLFRNWYTAAVSLGIISLILGFALQTPISSFIGWLYIVIRKPFHVGDRIQIDTFKGDVIEINYLDVTLWEFGGEYLTSDLPTGRLIRFPNSLVLESAVFNYSWLKFPYIWNEIPFHIAYESDLEFVTKTMKAVAKEEMGDEMAKNIEKYKSLLDQTPVGDIEIKEYPFVSFRTNTNTWLEAILTYLVEPKQAVNIRTTLVKKITLALLKQPEKVMFPKSNNR
ncbi:MAG: mechanosensitive ion channel family protein [Chitinophagales bacterium]